MRRCQLRSRNSSLFWLRHRKADAVTAEHIGVIASRCQLLGEKDAEAAERAPFERRRRVDRLVRQPGVGIEWRRGVLVGHLYRLGACLEAQPYGRVAVPSMAVPDGVDEQLLH